MRAFAQVDVFTAVPGLGNPVAVVLDAEGLDTAAMQRFAAWTNLSETTFVLPPTTPGADYQVRIFTPGVELPFAGHPTIGTCRALLDAGRITPRAGRVVQQCAAGPVELEVADDGTITFTAPRTVVVPQAPGTAELGRALGVTPRDPLLLDVGPHWLTARLDPAELDALRPDPVLLPELFATHGWYLTLYAVEGAGPDAVVHVRSFFLADGLAEDPVCGSGNVAVALHLRTTGADDVPQTYPARQGRHRGRDGRLLVGRGERITVGGQAVVVVSGSVSLQPAG